MTHARQALGAAAEDLAAEWLAAEGYRILARRWRGAGREIDLVAEKDGIVAFVEVKARRGRPLASPLTAVDWRKRRQIAAAARVAIQTLAPGARAYRFDVCSVTWEGAEARVEHVVDAFRLEP